MLCHPLIENVFLWFVSSQTQKKPTPITDTPQYFNPFYALLKKAYIDQHMTVLGETYLVGGLDQYN